MFRRLACDALFVIMGMYPATAAAQAVSGGPLRELQNRVAALQAEMDTLRTRVAVLESETGARTDPVELTVNCADGQTVSAALAQTAAARKVSITISGTCQEAVTIERDDVTLAGAAPGDGLKAPYAGANVLWLWRADRIYLRRLTITGGKVGVSAQGSTFEATQIHVSGAMEMGIAVHGASSGFVNDSIIENNGGGVSADSGGAVEVSGSGTVIGNNGYVGLLANVGGKVALLGGATVSGSSIGIAGFVAGVIRVRDGAIVENNTYNGIDLAIDSTLNLATGAIVRGNGQHGVSLRDTSVAELGDERVPPQILNNGGYGIVCAASPGVAQLGMGVATVTGNALGQIKCPLAGMPN